ncbi:MAG TPA: M23 family metallopeptidase [Gemmatimonadaceae bacterium]|nr:M23 family metallopeptidase [Gemmatimonadaceae bacterium]
MTWTKTGAASVRVTRWSHTGVVLGAWLGAACGSAITPLPPARAPAPSGVAVPAPAEPVAAPPNAIEVLRRRHLMVPVDGVGLERVQNTYDAVRDGGTRRHYAIDIMAPRGTAVLAADNGSILRMGFNALGGLTIYQIDPEKRFVYYYAHLDRYASTIQDGRVVSRGDVIGYVGATGNASPTAPHLHFQVLLFRERYWEGESVNPFGIFGAAGKRR